MRILSPSNEVGLLDSACLLVSWVWHDYLYLSVTFRKTTVYCFTFGLCIKIPCISRFICIYICRTCDMRCTPFNLHCTCMLCCMYVYGVVSIRMHGRFIYVHVVVGFVVKVRVV